MKKMDKKELQNRLSRLRNQINVLGFGLSTLRMSFEELVIQFNELVDYCAALEPSQVQGDQDRTKEPPAVETEKLRG
jgi:regulator of replication initiation timing